MNVLFITSEVFPLVKTGGLADVSGALVNALQQCDANVTLMLPAFLSVREKLPSPSASYTLQDAFLPPDIVLLEHVLPGSGARLLLVDAPECFDRAGGPYVDPKGHDWPDNPLRFGLFCRVVAAVAAGRSSFPQRFDVVHCNDWQTGLIPALIAHERLPVRTVFTIHNLAYQGVFGRDAFDALQLPPSWWSYDKVEFYGNFSFLKAGIVFADAVTTVSPTYAREILQEPMACGMSGLLQYHRHKLTGILNGADYEVWNPASDLLIPCRYSADSLAQKSRNKEALQRSLGLKPAKSTPVIGMVSRLVHQKGVDWVIAVMEAFLAAGTKVQWAILGAGDRALEQRLQALATQHPQQIAVTIGYDETLAHRIEAGADLFIMPSRYEPCGLNQMYSLRYGTLPIVRATGGLADTVVDTDAVTLANGTATGFVYQGDADSDLATCVRRALDYFGKQKQWQAIQRNAMGVCFDWTASAQLYMAIYGGVGTLAHTSVGEVQPGAALP